MWWKAVLVLLTLLNIIKATLISRCDLYSLSGDEEDSCIWIEDDNQTWRDARQSCKDEGGDLLVFSTLKSITSKTSDILKRSGNLSSHWIGLKTSKYSSKKWAWINDNELLYPNWDKTNWDSNETNKWLSGEKCGTFMQSGRWNAVLCSSLQEGRMCEAPKCMFHNGYCQHICKPKACSCYPGNKLINKTHCVEINMCDSSPCQQHCQSKNGTIAICSCDSGYLLVGKYSCVDNNPCNKNNGGCFDICKQSENGTKAVCSCRGSYRIVGADGMSCQLNSIWAFIVILTPAVVFIIFTLSCLLYQRMQMVNEMFVIRKERQRLSIGTPYAGENYEFENHSRGYPPQRQLSTSV